MAARLAPVCCYRSVRQCLRDCLTVRAGVGPWEGAVREQPPPPPLVRALGFCTGCAALLTGQELGCSPEERVCHTAVGALHLRRRAAGRLAQGHVAGGDWSRHRKQSPWPLSAAQSQRKAQGQRLLI